MLKFIGCFPPLQKGNAAFCVIFQDASSAPSFIPHPAHSAKMVLQQSIEMVWKHYAHNRTCLRQWCHVVLRTLPALPWQDRICYILILSEKSKWMLKGTTLSCVCVLGLCIRLTDDMYFNLYYYFIWARSVSFHDIFLLKGINPLILSNWMWKLHANDFFCIKVWADLAQSGDEVW